nr:helix-turn-helix domain-containing protein [Gordonia sp. (in: high G+C Gram-positive bacteria)]
RLAARADGPRFTFGTVQSGLSGFRRSHREAIALRRVAGDHSVVDAADPGMMLTALVGTDRQAAHDWAETVLGPLASDTEPDARMRATLRVFLRTGGSYKATAEELLLHPNSVKYRVGRAIERRGRPIGDDRLDVEAALLVLDATSAGSPD